MWPVNSFNRNVTFLIRGLVAFTQLNNIGEGGGICPTVERYLLYKRKLSELCMCVCTYVCIGSMCVCMYVRTCMCVCVYEYKHIIHSASTKF